MPESLGSVGNYPAEDLVRMLELLQIKTGLNVERVTQASKEIAALLDISPRSHSALDCTREAVMQWGKDHPREHPA
jgi:hydroxymethylglutaryl-CoA lyase